jgi:hypothetical protein
LERHKYWRRGTDSSAYLINWAISCRRNYTYVSFPGDIYLQKGLKEPKRKNKLDGIKAGHGPNLANPLKVVGFPVFPHI